MRRQAAESDIIIVNHHLFFADLAVKEDEYGGIIPEYAAVIFDEAHEIEDVAGQYFGISISNYQLSDVRRDIAALARRKGFGSPDLDTTLDSFDARTVRFFDLFENLEGRTGIPAGKVFAPDQEERYADLQAALEAPRRRASSSCRRPPKSSSPSASACASSATRCAS